MLSKVILMTALIGLSSALDTSDYLQDISTSLFGSGDDDTSMEETGRFGFVTLNNQGIVLTFNTTSLTYGLLTILGIAGLIAAGAAIAAAIAIPIAVGLGVKKHFYGGDDYGDYSDSGSGGGYGYQSTGGSSYSSYAKRSLEVMSPVMKALYSAYNKYNGKEEKNVAL